MIYRALFSTVFTRMDPEDAHHGAMAAFRVVEAVPPLRWMVAHTFGRRVRRAQSLADAPGVGVAAGFDKNARVPRALIALGFGHVEVGTVTALPQPGNDRPRLWRILPERALRNRMGFNNDGAVVVGRRLAKLRARRGPQPFLGVNIGKSKVTEPGAAAADYATSAALLGPYADYLVINVSSPNTPGLRDLQAVEALRPIVEAVQGALANACVSAPPLFVKIAPDLLDDDVDAVCALVRDAGLAGVVATNTTIAHDLGPGGVSGPPLRARALDVVARVRRNLPDALVVGCGGISTPADVRAFRAAGADAVQGYTAFIYQGPAWPGRLARSS